MPPLFYGYTFYTLKKWYAPYKYLSCQALATSQGATFQFVDLLPDAPLLAIDLILVPDPLQASDPSLPKSLNRGANEDVHTQYLVSMVSVSWLEECVAKQEVLPNDQGNPSGSTDPNDQVIPCELHAAYVKVRDAVRKHNWSKSHCRRFFAQWYKDNPQDTIPWVELYMKVLESDCPAFAASGLLHPRFHRPKPQKTPANRSAVASHSVTQSSHRISDAHGDASTMLQTESTLTAPIRTHGRRYLADQTWLKARGWTRDSEGLWSNADPIFRCGRCDSAGRVCRFKVVYNEATSGGLRVRSCTWCTSKHETCSAASRSHATTYFCVQAEDGSFKWNSAGRNGSRQPVCEEVPSRGLSPEYVDNGPHGEDVDPSDGVLDDFPKTAKTYDPASRQAPSTCSASTSESPYNHADDVGPSRQAQGPVSDTYGADTGIQCNDLDPPMVLDSSNRHPTPTSQTAIADSPLIHRRDFRIEEQASESEEEMTYIEWEKVRSGDTMSKQALEVELTTPAPGTGSLDQDMYDNHDNQISLGDENQEELNEAIEGSVAAPDQTQCLSESPQPSNHHDEEAGGWSNNDDTRSATGESSLAEIDWINVKSGVLHGPHDTLSVSDMERLLHMAAFSPPNEQNQHILPTTFWPKLLNLCAKGEKFSQIMKFVGVSYKADLYDKDFAIPILQDGYWSLVIVDHARMRITAVVSGEEIVGLEEQVKVIRIAAHATQDIKENEVTRLQAVPRANTAVYDKPYKLCLKRVSDHVPPAVTGHVILAFACQYNGPEAVGKMLGASLDDPERLADRAYLRGILEVFDQDG